MNRNTSIFLLTALLLIIAAAALIFTVIPAMQGRPLISFNHAESGPAMGAGANTVQARVLDIIEQGEITLGEHTQTYQIVRIEILEGAYAGRKVEIDYGQRQILPSDLTMQEGDMILVTVGERPEGGGISAFFTDFVRTQPLLWLFLIFVVFSVLMSGWKGLRSLLAMGLSLAVIISYIIPQILAGKDPVLVSITGAFTLLTITLYLTYGWTLKTHASVLGMLIALLITGTLASIFVNTARLTGAGSEYALFLVQMAETKINLKGLILGGMIIGALGVLDDLVTTQASAVFELHAADPQLKLAALFRRAMRIGQDHVAATINTLVLAYAGAALPMLLLFSLSGENMAYLVNLEYVAEEIVRTLVGSLGLISAVPLTTLIAAALVLYQDRLGGLRKFLGPENLGGGHSHSHG